MDDEKYLDEPGDEPDDDQDAPEVSAGKARRNSDTSAATAQRKRIQRMRERAERFDREDTLAHDIQCAKEELLAQGCRPSDFQGGRCWFAFELIRDLIRGIASGFFSIQNSSADHHENWLVLLDQAKTYSSLDELTKKNYPLLPFVDAAIDAIIDWSREWKIEKYGPTDRLIERAINSACEFFEREPKHLDRKMVERAQKERHLYSLSRQRHGDKPFRQDFVPTPIPAKPEPEPEPEAEAIQTTAIVVTGKDAIGNDFEKILEDVTNTLSSHRIMSDVEILKAIQLQLPPLGSEPA